MEYCYFEQVNIDEHGIAIIKEGPHQKNTVNTMIARGYTIVQEPKPIEIQDHKLEIEEVKPLIIERPEPVITLSEAFSNKPCESEMLKIDLPKAKDIPIKKESPQIMPHLETAKRGRPKLLQKAEDADTRKKCKAAKCVRYAISKSDFCHKHHEMSKKHKIELKKEKLPDPPPGTDLIIPF